MKNARPIKDESGAADQGAVIFTQGNLPKRKNTATADVLSRLLNYERLTGMEAVLKVFTKSLQVKLGQPVMRFTHFNYSRQIGGNAFEHRKQLTEAERARNEAAYEALSRRN